MIYDYSIENSIEKIQNLNTKLYFKEVYQTFVNGNYRSSTVMLYSVLICDLVYKLRDLRDIYSDGKAKSIMDDIESAQKKNPTSSEWESQLINKIKTETNLLQSSDIAAIEALQNYRHLSAHPVLDNADLLFSPNRETVQSLIRNILEGVLTNPPFFSNKIFDTMLSDLSEVKDKITEYEKVKSYITSRYLKAIKANDFKKIYRSLWKIVFITINQQTEENSRINYQTLKIFTSSDKATCIQLLKNEPEFYSKINNDKRIEKLVHFLSKFPELYALLEPSVKLLIENKINENGNWLLTGWFLKNNLNEHIQSLDVENISDINKNVFQHIKDIAIEDQSLPVIIDFGLDYFSKSNDWATSQNRFDNVISVIENDLGIEQTKKLLLLSNESSQIYNRWGMRVELKRIANRFINELDITEYPMIFT